MWSIDRRIYRISIEKAEPIGFIFFVLYKGLKSGVVSLRALRALRISPNNGTYRSVQLV